jgi:hypothetical protein
MKLPALQFYIGDWRKDVGIQSLDFEARGIWFEMLCLMHESERRGTLTLKGRSMGRHQIARLLGISEEDFGKIFQRLLDAGVPSVEDDGTIVCRRMVRDEQTRKARAECGKMGGNPKLGINYNRPGFVYAIQRASDKAVKIGVSTSPQTRLYKIRNHQKCDCEMLAFLAVEDMGKKEAELHSKFRPSGHSGEWFELSESSICTLVSTLKGKAKQIPEDEDEDEDTSKLGDARGKKNSAEQIYEHYPRKVNRLDALKAIAKSLQKHDFEYMLSRTVEFATRTKGCDPQFVPYPASWFNAGGYDSDPTEWGRIGRNGNQQQALIPDYEKGFQ